MDIGTQKFTLFDKEHLRYVATWRHEGRKITVSSQIFFENDPPIYKALMLERFAAQIVRHLDVHPTPGWKKPVDHPVSRE